MNKSVLFLLLAIIAFPAVSQQVVPGGVGNPYIWNTANDKGSFTSQKSSISKDSITTASSRKCSINNNPAAYFTGIADETSIDLSKVTGYTLFTVCQPIDTANEQVIFTTEGDTSIETVLTSSRLASIDQYKYANFNGIPVNFPRIYSYSIRNDKDTIAIARRLRLGQTPRKQALPVQAFGGIVPEVILYNRNLTYREKLRIESYLAIKYGIPLGQQFPTSYLNSRGDTIWNAEVNTAYATNITGIGRDDVSGLRQPVSECIQTPGFIKVSYDSKLDNNSFVIWGDNGGDARFGEYHSLPRCLGRSWKLNAFKASGTKINICANSLAIEEIKPLREGETYWLMRDKSGLGNYPFGNTNYVKCDESSLAKDTIRFDNMCVDADTSGADVVTLIAMPELFTRAVLISPECNKSGTVQVEIVGGTPPYRLVLSSQDKLESLQTVTTNANSYEFNTIVQGGYTLVVNDANNHSYSQEIWVGNGHSWDCKIKQQYKIEKGSIIQLDASVGLPNGFAYSWKTPDNEVISSPLITISKSGTYFLSITDLEGCASILKIKVVEYELADISATEVFPNPTSGNFVVRATLTTTAPLTISISDATGKILNTKILTGNKFYQIHGTVPVQGLYIINLSTLKDRKTLKLICN